MSDDNETVLQVLRGFFAAMRGWETRSFRRDRDQVERGSLDPDEANRLCDAELCEIFDRYCLRFGEPYRTGTFAIPSEYDPEGEKILRMEVGGRAAVVYTHQTTSPPFEKLVYLLREVDGQWRILDFRMRVLDDGGLTPWYL